jgi:NADH dehydrogenase
VTVRTGAMVTSVDREGVTLAGDERISASTVLWAAGVKAAPVAASLGVELDRAGRVPVQPDLTIAEYPEIYVVGDLATLPGKDGRPLPGVAQVAMQQGRLAAANVLRRIVGSPGEVFKYRDLGNMATIGRNHAIADIGPVEIGGFVAWVAWLFIHILNLIGYRNRAAVMLQWILSYFTFQRGARLITSTAQSHELE